MDGARRGGVRDDYTSLGDALARYDHARYFTGPGQAGKARAALWWLFWPPCRSRLNCPRRVQMSAPPLEARSTGAGPQTRRLDRLSRRRHRDRHVGRQIRASGGRQQRLGTPRGRGRTRQGPRGSPGSRVGSTGAHRRVPAREQARQEGRRQRRGRSKAPQRALAGVPRRLEGVRGERAEAASRVSSPEPARLVPRQGRHQLLRGVVPGGQVTRGDSRAEGQRRVR